MEQKSPTPFLRFAALSIALVSAATLAQNSALDASGEKRITVGSEIARGSSEIFTETLNRLDLSIVALNAHMADVIVRNQSRQTDSVGFMLGARYQEWRQLELLLRSAGVRKFNSAAEIESGLRDSKSYFVQMRSLQKELGIDDDALISALGITNPEGIAQMKAQIAGYIAATGIK